MPYSSINDKSLPSYVRKLSESNKRKWINIFNEVHKKEGEKMAFIVANRWLKNRLKKKSRSSRTYETRDRLYFVVDNSKELISRTENGEEFVSFKLADVNRDKLGVQLPIDLLEKWAEQINSGDAIIGDIDHEELNKLERLGLDDEEIITRLKQKKGIAKGIKALVKDGMLWVKALIDKRYRRLIEKAKGVSMEALIERDISTDDINDGKLLGFTFGIKDTPVINGTEVNYYGAS